MSRFSSRYRAPLILITCLAAAPVAAEGWVTRVEGGNGTTESASYTEEAALASPDAAAVSCAAGPETAVLDQLQGEVLLSSGDGFVPVTEATGLAAGDRVAVGASGFARIAYSGGTMTEVRSGEVATVVDCPAGDGGIAPVDSSIAAIGVTPIIVGGAVAAGAVAAVASAASGGNNEAGAVQGAGADRPASP